MAVIDLSIYRKDDLEIKSLKGNIYTIPGNFSTEFYINLYDKYQKIQSKKKKDEAKEYMQIAKDLALDILKLDKSKNVTMETIENEFDDLNVLIALISEIITYANDINNDPLQVSPTLKSNQ